MAKNSETARIADLAEELLQALESQRRFGDAAYPPTLRQLAELCEGSPPVELVIKAAGKKPFKDKAAVDKENKQPKLDSAVYFKEDKPSKAELTEREDARLTEKLLQVLESQRQLGDHAYPLTLRRLAELCDGSPNIKQAVKLASKKTFTDRALLETKKGQAKEDSSVCFKEDYLPGAEREQRDLARLAERMLKVLESQRRLGDSAYPPALRRLVELCELKASDARVPGLVGHEALAGRVVVAGMTGKKPNLDAPAFLHEDSPNLLPALALFALNVSRTGAARAFTAKQLTTKLIPSLQKSVEAALARDQIEHQDIPPDLAWVPGAKGEPLFFHIQDLRPAARQRAPEASHEIPGKPHGSVAHSSNGVRHPSGRNFSEAFHEAFEQLDRRNRSTNFVKLSDLRRALPDFERDEFDAGLRQLRENSHYSLNSHEGLHGSLTPEDREAGVQEVGSLFIYASRR